MNSPPSLNCIEDCLACHLRSGSFFCALPQESLNAFGHLKSTEAYPANTVLFSEGQAPRGSTCFARDRPNSRGFLEMETGSFHEL